MNEHYVVTITRQFGSMGRMIAQKISENLKIGYYDRDIVENTAKQMNLPVSLISEAEEGMDRKLFRQCIPLGIQNLDIQDKIFQTQAKVINEIAERESCIIVGRCSDFVLQKLPNSFHIFIYAPYEDRLKNCNTLLEEDMDVAAKMIRTVDRARDNYHKKYARFLPDDIEHKDLLINSSLYGISGTADVLTELIKKRFNL